MIAEVWFTLTPQAIAAALLSGVALGWPFSVIRSGVDWPTFLRSSTALALLWFLPATITRLLDPVLFVTGIRTIGTFALFMAFLAMGTLTLALIERRKS